MSNDDLAILQSVDTEVLMRGGEQCTPARLPGLACICLAGRFVIKSI